MPRLQIVEINDPYEFVEKIQVDQNDNLYVFIENIFKPEKDIYNKIIDIYERYSCAVIFTDIKTSGEIHNTNQYFIDIQGPQDNKVIYSPICAKYIPLHIEIHSDLKYHAFSFLKQISKHILPWHIPNIGFEATMNNNQFQRLTEDSQWVLQHVT